MTACKAPKREKEPSEGDADTFEYRLPKYGESFAVIGVTQFGKSSFSKAWAAYLMERRFSVLAWDPANEWHVNGRKREFAKPGPLRNSVTVSELLKDPRLYLAKKVLSLAVRPDDIYAEEEEMAEQFRAFARWIRKACPAEPLAFFVDESGALRKHAESTLKDIAERWAKEWIVPILLAQRWSHFSTDVRAEFAWLIGFAQFKSSDLRFLTEDTNRAYAKSLATLGRDSHRLFNLRQAHAETLATL